MFLKSVPPNMRDLVSVAGQRLKQVLKQKKINQSDLSRMTGKSRQSINELINGHTMVAVETLCSICDVLNISMDYILDRKVDNWIPVGERLPDDPEPGMYDMDDLTEYNVMIDGATMPTTLYYAGNGDWYRDDRFYEVKAWQPLPDSYKEIRDVNEQRRRSSVY